MALACWGRGVLSASAAGGESAGGLGKSLTICEGGLDAAAGSSRISSPHPGDAGYTAASRAILLCNCARQTVVADGCRTLTSPASCPRQPAAGCSLLHTVSMVSQGQGAQEVGTGRHA
jgi:hypothetical protein